MATSYDLLLAGFVTTAVDALDPRLERHRQRTVTWVNLCPNVKGSIRCKFFWD